jgi:hypothetical protein
MSLYWIVKYTLVPKYQVSDGYQYFELIANTKNKNRAKRLVKIYQEIELVLGPKGQEDKRKSEQHQTKEITYFEVKQNNPNAKYIAFLYNDQVSDPDPEFWETDPPKTKGKDKWVELIDEDMDYISQFDDVQLELIKYKNTNKKSRKRYAAIYPLELTKPDLFEIRKYWEEYIYNLHKNLPVVKYWIIKRRNYKQGPFSHSYELEGSFNTKEEMEKELEKLKELKDENNDEENEFYILKQKDPNSKYIAIIYNKNEDIVDMEFWNKDIESGWKELEEDEETPNEFIEYKNNKGRFAATLPLT